MAWRTRWPVYGSSRGVRQANGIIAGTSGMHWRRFVIFNALGAALWVGVSTSVGYFSGSHITTVYNDATRYSTYLAFALAALLVALIARRLMRVRRPGIDVCKR